MADRVESFENVALASLVVGVHYELSKRVRFVCELLHFDIELLDSEAYQAIMLRNKLLEMFLETGKQFLAEFLKALLKAVAEDVLYDV